jgi:branched-chain amino acid transport system permease protein
VAHRLVLPAAGSVVLWALLVAGGLVYTTLAGGPADLLVTQMLINVILVVGLQAFVGNTGVLSFGHMAFGAVAGYTVVLLAAPPRLKERVIPNAPWGLTGVEVHPVWATAAAVAVALALGVVVGLALARAGSRSGQISGTVITLALLFVVHAVAVERTDLTAGGGGLTLGPGNTLEGRWWIYAAVLGALVAARLFRETRTGRWAQAGREDPLAAGAMGIDLVRPQTVALLVSVAIVAVGASLRVQQLGSITPSFFYFDLTLLTLTMLVVGGRNGVAGAVVGTVLITAGREVTRQAAAADVLVPGTAVDLLPDGLSDLFLGLAMVGFMIARPQGLLRDRELDQVLRRALPDRRVPPAPPPPRPERPPVGLEVRDVTVDFGGFRALEGVSLEAGTYEVVGLIGPNGAGKTTLLNVITGLVAPTGGTVRIGGIDVTGAPAHRIARAGLARTFQNLRLFGGLTVRENLEVTALARARYRPGAHPPDIEALLAWAGLAGAAEDRRAAELDYGTQRRLELARAAALSPDFLLLDEPTSGMSDAESAQMIDHVRTTAASVGAGVVVIDHDLHFITNVCDRIYVLDQGRVIAHGTPAEIQAHPEVRAAYLGEAVS